MAEGIALYHHERWDGSGYSAGLVGEAIPMQARIAAVADVFDALTQERPYKRAWSTKAGDGRDFPAREAVVRPQSRERF
jgi:putative two-component system response regulator